MTADPVVHVVDDDDAVRESLQLLLEAEGIRVQAHVSADDFLQDFTPAGPGCILCDLRMPGTDGIGLLKVLGARSSRVPVVMMTGFGDVEHAVLAMKAGAFDFIEKPFRRTLLLDVVQRALEAAQATAAETAAQDDARDRVAGLTDREREVLQLLVAGKANKVIAHVLGISPRTVEIHRARVMEKMGVRSLSEVVRLALAAGVLPDGGGK